MIICIMNGHLHLPEVDDVIMSDEVVVAGGLTVAGVLLPGAGEAVTGGLLVDPATGGSSGGGQVSRSLICFLSQLVKWETSE